MKKVHIRSVKPGDKIAKTILSEAGQVLLAAGLELSQRYIDRLKALGIDTVYIEDEHTDDIVPEDVLSDTTRKKAVETVYKMMTGLMDQPKVTGRIAMPDMGKVFRNVFGNILGDLSGRKDIMVNLVNLHSLGGYLFHHSVNVAVLAGIIGLAKGYNREQLMDLGVGALLFDIGMIMLPKDLWNKKTMLTEEERAYIENHTEDGFNILRYQYDMSLLSAHCALQHHERYNGSGYPRKLEKDQIHEYAQIVGIADVYDALTSHRSHRQHYTPNEALEYLFASGNTLFDLELVKLFVKHIAAYPIASTVVLNTGQIGVVSHVHPNAVHRPIVRIVQERDGTVVKAPYEIDLKTHTNIVITRTL
ncbi:MULTISPECIES: HD-GYP domain-containing protein [Aneurinibacillus]|uniref:HD-GYP domain, c-di-GMP phosphodiesterase class II (Or its inactivated variant) n=1 Tax=Aneurinibacillus thermoaerophilus TaxID=143495 RepID=A0A1G8CPX1_ANETH|nr:MULTISPECIES: HD-GYP domain-containing protein [Aneurinibacillus]AMA74587.1 metal-dependent phosphohydrolase [Aneurinibacillus sp. XH2]MED0677218.1 HD-GYP domain-containing protein [Aneurinibacillus thermoaerophilus]MED0680474.1 HD-GYP domain-containing protein [Aneurinibacillus thermoaerophilus]MED0737266.1 HD-GYP domain-containing protein [Aneurinibacillus thermoaerophilus]MED0757919.1 HD-GYP domain-containing protein [Aneurinibacillus thermoaerophilus]